MDRIDYLQSEIFKIRADVNKIQQNLDYINRSITLLLKQTQQENESDKMVILELLRLSTKIEQKFLEITNQFDTRIKNIEDLLKFYNT